MSNYDVSLILPCYNEGPTFYKSIERVIKALDGSGYTWEIIFIEDKSIDKTAQTIKKIIQKYKKRVISSYFHEKNQGRGYSVIDGINKANGKIVGYIDIDLEIGEWYLPKFIETIYQGADCAIAKRVYDLSFMSLPRWFASKGYCLLRKVILNLPYLDTEAGFKFFMKDKITPLIKHCHFRGWFWDTEIMARIYHAGLNVEEIPVAFVKRVDKASTVKLIPDTIKYLLDLINFRIYH